MTSEQLRTLLKAIKSTYPMISVNNEMIDEWGKRLANYDFKDIEAAFNNYVLSGNKETITLVDLIRDQKTISQKKPIVGDFFCIRCNKHYSTMEECDKCYERDLDIKYITKMSKIFNINTNEYFKPELNNCSLEQINKQYDNFIWRVIEEQKKEPKLKGQELEGLRDYYKHVLMKGGLLANEN